MKEIMSVVKAPLAFPRSIGGQGDDFQRQTNLLKLTQEVLEEAEASLQVVAKVERGCRVQGGGVPEQRQPEPNIYCKVSHTK